MALFLISALLVLLAIYAGLCVFYYLAQEKFIFVRFRMPQDHEFKFKGPYEERWLDRPDGARLHALYFKAAAPRGVVLYFHGNTGSLRRWGKVAPRFTTLGYDVLMPDPRGYGKSRGTLSEAALHADAQAWYDQLKEQWTEQEVVVYGRSLGSGLAVPIAAGNAPCCLLLETPFANLIEVARYYLAILPYRLLLRYTFRNDLHIHRVKCPVYIFHGKRDRVVPYASALRLYSMIPPEVHREMITFPKGAHSDLARFATFTRRLRSILAPAAND